MRKKATTKQEQQVIIRPKMKKYCYVSAFDMPLIMNRRGSVRRPPKNFYFLMNFFLFKALLIEILTFEYEKIINMLRTIVRMKAISRHRLT
jgi:hypothetical protein